MKDVSHKELVNLIIDIGTSTQDTETLAARKQQALRLIDLDIARGFTGMHVAKALLSSSDDWSTCEITDADRFRAILEEGIARGCLRPDNHIGWDWMETAAKNNDPACFMENMERYYDILADAAEHGVVEAMDIRDTIWEPENCQEED